MITTSCAITSWTTPTLALTWVLSEYTRNTGGRANRLRSCCSKFCERSWLLTCLVGRNTLTLFEKRSALSGGFLFFCWIIRRHRGYWSLRKSFICHRLLLGDSLCEEKSCVWENTLRRPCMGRTLPRLDRSRTGREADHSEHFFWRLLLSQIAMLWEGCTNLSNLLGIFS